MSDYFEGLKLAQRIGVPCKDCATASIWCGPCAAKWHKACEDQKQVEQRQRPQDLWPNVNSRAEPAA